LHFPAAIRSASSGTSADWRGFVAAYAAMHHHLRRVKSACTITSSGGTHCAAGAARTGFQHRQDRKGFFRQCLPCVRAKPGTSSPSKQGLLQAYPERFGGAWFANAENDFFAGCDGLCALITHAVHFHQWRIQRSLHFACGVPTMEPMFRPLRTP